MNTPYRAMNSAQIAFDNLRNAALKTYHEACAKAESRLNARTVSSDILPLTHAWVDYCNEKDSAHNVYVSTVSNARAIT